jgi:uncharacterized GH25 family protein
VKPWSSRACKLHGFLLLLALAGPASAHDFWIQPSSFRPEARARVAIDLRVGERFVGESVARNPERIDRFFVIAAGAEATPIAGIDAKAPAGYWTPSTDGLAWIGYRSRPSAVELPAEKFESYLAEEGLERVVDLRRIRGERKAPGRERYSRCAKALVQVGSPNASSRAREAKLGFPLELFPDQDPYALRAGDTFSVRLAYLDKPLEGALVGAMVASDPDAEVRVRTDADGRARFTLARDGAYLVRVVHMVHAPADSEYEWESLWASLTFELRSPAQSTFMNSRK